MIEDWKLKKKGRWKNYKLTFLNHEGWLYIEAIITGEFANGSREERYRGEVAFTTREARGDVGKFVSKFNGYDFDDVETKCVKCVSNLLAAVHVLATSSPGDNTRIF